MQKNYLIHYDHYLLYFDAQIVPDLTSDSTVLFIQVFKALHFSLITILKVSYRYYSGVSSVFF
jgi:hypothetical protein